MLSTILSSVLNFAVFAFVVFIFVMWFWLLITVIGDLFSRSDVGGFGKVLWVILLVVLPYLGVFLYILSQGKGMGERKMAQVAKARDDLREFVGVGIADEIAKLEKLKADGSITADEFTRLRARVIG